MRTIVVDDEPWMLKRFEIESDDIPDIQLIGSFRNPSKAIEFVAANHVELAFLDIRMPELNGYELAKELRAVNPDIVIIFISAYDSNTQEANTEKTTDQYITKPYDADDIVSAVGKACRISGLMHEKADANTGPEFKKI